MSQFLHALRADERSRKRVRDGSNVKEEPLVQPRHAAFEHNLASGFGRVFGLPRDVASVVMRMLTTEDATALRATCLLAKHAVAATAWSDAATPVRSEALDDWRASFPLATAARVHAAWTRPLDASAASAALRGVSTLVVRGRSPARVHAARISRSLLMPLGASLRVLDLAGVSFQAGVDLALVAPLLHTLRFNLTIAVTTRVPMLPVTLRVLRIAGRCRLARLPRRLMAAGGLPALEHLDLSGVWTRTPAWVAAAATSASVLALLRGVAATLRVLSVRRLHLGTADSEDAVAATTAIAGMSHLRVLCVARTVLGDGVLANKPVLEQLDAADSRVSDAGLARVRHALVALDVSDCAAVTAAAFRRTDGADGDGSPDPVWPRLRRLGIDAHPRSPMRAALADAGARLEFLDVSECRGAPAKRYAAALPFLARGTLMPALTTLRLPSPWRGGVTLPRAAAAALPSLRTLLWCVDDDSLRRSALVYDALVSIAPQLTRLASTMVVIDRLRAAARLAPSVYCVALTATEALLAEAKLIERVVDCESEPPPLSAAAERRRADVVAAAAKRVMTQNQSTRTAAAAAAVHEARAPISP